MLLQELLANAIFRLSWYILHGKDSRAIYNALTYVCEHQGINQEHKNMAVKLARFIITERDAIRPELLKDSRQQKGEAP